MPEQANTPTLFEHLRGKRTKDINLSPESGQVDPELAGKAPLEQLKKAFDMANKRALGDDPLAGLRSVANQ